MKRIYTKKVCFCMLNLFLIIIINNLHAQSPTISSFSPKSGCIGTTVKLNGKYFTGATTVGFGGTITNTFTVNNDSTITAYVPSGATTGALSVSTPNGSISNNVFSIGSFINYAFISNGNDNTVSVINTANNSVVGTVLGGGYAEGVSVSPDGTKVYLVSYGDNSVYVLNTTTYQITTSVRVGATNFARPIGICISPDGSKGYVTNQNESTVSILNTNSNTILTNVNVDGGPSGICISPDGSKVYVVCGSGTVDVISTSSNSVIATIGVGNNPFGICISPDGSKLYVTNDNYAGSIRVINALTNSVISTISCGNFPIGVSITPDGSKVFVANGGALVGNSNVNVINTTTNLVDATITVGNRPSGICVSTDGTKAFAENAGSNSVSVINVSTYSVDATLNVGQSPYSIGNFIGNIPSSCPLNVNYIWTGSTSSDWNDATNWSSGIVPTNTSSIIIPAAPNNQPILNTDVVVNNIEIDGTITLNSKIITLNGSVTGTGTLKGSTTSSLVIGGTVGTISFDANNNSLQNLTINGTTTLGNALNLYGKLTVNTGGTLTTGSNLTLKSVSTGTAVVEQETGTISGTVKVEIYIPKGYSAHRDLGVCVSGAGTITNTWGDSLKNYLVYNYNSASGWTTIPNSSSLNKYIGYRVLVSGHNNPVVPTTYISYMNSDVTLAYSGTLLTGNQSIPLTAGTDKFSFVSNPYASQVDFNALTKSGLYDGYWYLDPTTLYGNYENYNYYGSKTGFNNVYAKTASQYLQSGQGFFVCSNTTTPSLTFTESSKNNNNSQVSIFGATTPLNRIATGLFTNGKNLDGAVVVFNNNFSNGVSKEDGLKINNQGENLTFSVAGKELCANGWSMPTATDELPIHLYQLNKSTAYSLRLDASQFIGNGLNAYLKDNLLNTQTLLKGDSNMISFATTTDTFSNRFIIVFKPTTLPVKSISATATLLKGNEVDIKWKVIGESNVVSYQVERSSDGINFTSIITTAPYSSNNYSYIDATTISNTNYYRIKAVDNVGEVSYSNISSVELNNHQLSVIPNPIVNKSFKIGLTAVGKFTVSLVNKSGQIVYTTQLNHSVASTLENIVIGKSLAAGSYTITATDESGKAVSKEVIIQ